MKVCNNPICPETGTHTNTFCSVNGEQRCSVCHGPLDNIDGVKIGEIVRIADAPTAVIRIESIDDFVTGEHPSGKKFSAKKLNCSYPTARELEEIRVMAKTGFFGSHKIDGAAWLAACDATVKALHEKMLGSKKAAVTKAVNDAFERVMPEKSTGKKFDSEKTQYHLMPLYALELTNRVLMHGGKKYGEHNWQQVEGWEHRYYNAVLRHVFAWQSGEKNDPESGIHHLAHAICSLMFLIELEREFEREE